ncbi:MAG: hypothetical protein IPN14_16530 [Bacteroidetes bacterium]|nr:hypothetical protein [Bacteroidota bacterium]
MKRVTAEPMDEQNGDFVNRKVEILLKNGKRINGFIIGYFKKDIDDLNAPVIKWHLVDEQHLTTFGIDPFGYLIGTIIAQKDILQIKCIDSI